MRHESDLLETCDKMLKRMTNASAKELEGPKKQLGFLFRDYGLRSCGNAL